MKWPDQTDDGVGAIEAGTALCGTAPVVVKAGQADRRPAGPGRAPWRGPWTKFNHALSV
jgi:hypothetical protein